MALHALEWYEKHRGPVDGLMLLQPTSPFRKKSTLLKSIDLFGKNDFRSVIGVSPVKSHPEWTYRIEGNKMIPYVGNGKNEVIGRHQDLPSAFAINGAMYLSQPTTLRRSRAFIDSDAFPFVMNDPVESIDIDTDHDFSIASHFASLF